MGGFVFQLLGASFLSEGHPMEGMGFDGEKGVVEKIIGWECPPSMGNSVMGDTYIDSNLKPLTKLTSSSRSTEFKGISHGTSLK